MKRNLLALGVFAVLISLFALAANDGKLPWHKPPEHGADWCEAHRTPLSRCPKCNPKLARGGTFTVREREPREGECPNTLVRVTLAPGIAERVGLELHAVELRPVSETLSANAETEYAPARFARVAPRIAGVIRELSAGPGDEVSPGAVLARVESVELGEAKIECLQARTLLDLRDKTVRRLRSLVPAGAPPRTLEEAEAALTEADLALRRARQRLALLGLPENEIARAEETGDVSPLLAVVAPLAGTIVEAAAVPGEIASPERPIFAIADLDRLWLRIDVPEGALGRVEKGQRVAFTVEGLPGEKILGRVAAIGGEVDDRTRTARVFAEVKNPRRLLRARMFGRATITIRTAEPKLLVPKEAVQNDGDCTLVFVSPAPNVFQARKIEIGTVFESGYEVAGGLAAGEKVVTTGSFLLKTELLRGQMGAG